jgi:hypothetical protein
MAEGMKTEMLDGAKYVDLPELLSWYRRKIIANPTRPRRHPGTSI